MANFPTKRKNLPPPPTAAEAPVNLAAPETAPLDGRSARSTGRTAQLATRVRPDWLRDVKVYAAQNQLKLVEVLEQGFEALQKQHSKRS